VVLVGLFVRYGTCSKNDKSEIEGLGLLGIGFKGNMELFLAGRYQMGDGVQG
jgi:hypothetical protein